MEKYNDVFSIRKRILSLNKKISALAQYSNAQPCNTTFDRMLHLILLKAQSVVSFRFALKRYKRLSRRNRAILYLRIHRHLSSRQIAKRLKISIRIVTRILQELY